jgi:hypothetical protein
VVTNALEQYAAFIFMAEEAGGSIFLGNAGKHVQCHNQRTQSEFSMKASNIKLYLVVCLTFYAYKKYGKPGFVTAGNIDLQLYCLYHKIMLHEVKKYKFSKLKCKIM